ncbi:dumpy-19 [Loa loa]|uniref:Dumpy-19 n=1 Tax=Loa loa TaxID=7209 RepID=A0A1I7VM15_LOALO|nr:dumpy-19 [Loa loa]EJD76141.1 dumpy-19 [Loa loa]
MNGDTLIPAVLNYSHISTLFENDRHFSHLADFEREMAYRTEMGLYYSFYKKLISEPSFLETLNQITNDNVTEYGHTINTLKRFNLYPEVILGIAFKLFKKIANENHWVLEQCWQVKRGDQLPPAISCEGIGNEHYFYITMVFALASTVASTIFLFGVLLSDTVLGGILAVCCFFFNHGQATRVQWTPPLRESFGYPVFLAQILVITYVLRYIKNGFLWSILIAYLTTIFMLFWQFSAFALTTQLGSIFATFILDFVPVKTMNTIVYGHAIAFFTSFMLLFGNEMLLTSFYLSSIITLWIILSLDRYLYRIINRLLYIVVNSTLYIAGTVGIKLIISHLMHVEDDAHIMDLLRAKFTSFANFHTRLYTCAKEFDFIGSEDLTDLMRTLMLPAAALSVLLVFMFFVQYEPLTYRDKIRNKPCAEIIYNVIQCICFIIMACLIMRLKLFMTPHLCIIITVLVNYEFVVHAVHFNMSGWMHRILVVVLLAAMAYQGVINIQKQWEIQGEYSNPDQEALFDWISRKTKSDSVFAGPMSVMANVKLSTGRPIVNHPHYEDAGLRSRTLKVYSLFSRKPLREVYDTLKEMGIDYYIFQPNWCDSHVTVSECSYRAIWDLQDPTNRERESLCDVILDVLNGRRIGALAPFKIVYSARSYVIFEL